MTKKMKRVLGGAAVFAVCAGVVFVMSLLYFFQVQTVVKDEIRTSLEEVSQHISTLMENKVTESVRNLQTVASVIPFYNIGEKSEAKDLMTFLKHESRRYGYARMSVITPDGMSHTSDGLVNSVKEKDYFKRALAGVSAISDMVLSIDDQVESIVYAVPIYKGAETTGVLRATNHLNELQKTMEISSFNGQGYSLIVKRDGAAIMRSGNANSAGAFSNMFDVITDSTIHNGMTVERIRQDMQDGDSGFLEYEALGVGKYMIYRPLQINRWYLLSIVPANVYADKAQSLTTSTLLICASIGLLFLVFLVYILLSRRKLRRLAYVDSVTGQQNENRFYMNAKELLRGSKDKQYDIVSFDINKFKLINDMYGYDAGNKTLAYVAKCVHEFLGADEAFARTSGDKFVMLILHLSDGDTMDRLNRLTTRINSFNRQAQTPYYLDITYGIYRITDKNFNISLMNDRAGIARKSIKEKHNLHCAFYHDASRNRMIEEKEIENTMDAALENGEFVVYLQPKVELEHNTVAGAEALVRWVHPEKGIISPNSFIPLFERNGFIVKLDYYMFESVCKQLRAWLDAGIEPIPISVNLSRVHLRNLNFIHRYKLLIHEYKIPPNLIEIELTETLVFDNMEILAGLIRELKDIGFSCSLDDFGTGFSSLNLLKEIPVDVLKLDREFFNEPKDIRRSNTVVSGVVAMAKSLGIRTVSEGVESEKQVNFLRLIGCDMVQGFIFARPMPVNEFEILIRGRRRADSEKNPKPDGWGADPVTPDGEPAGQPEEKEPPAE